MFRPRRRLLKLIVARADAARDQGRFRLAAELYDEALTLEPSRAGLHLQRAHMLKESGQFFTAEHHYRMAGDFGADAADLAIQIGHLFKVVGRLTEAREQYHNALALRPGWAIAQEQLDAFDRDRRGQALDEVASTRVSEASTEPATLSFRELGALAPALAPRTRAALLVRHDENIEVRRLGRREDGAWGVRRTLRGVEAVHGFILSEQPIVDLAVIVNGVELARDGLRGGFLLPLEETVDRLAKYVFNSWLDFSAFAPGLHALELRFHDAAGRPRSWHDRVVIAESVAEALYPDSDFLIASAPDDRRPLETQVRSRPSQVRQAARRLFPAGIRNVAVFRTDQLGDLVASLPALRRLRELVPHARIIGVFTEANADFARTLSDVVDEVVLIDFPDVLLEQRRTMPLDQQQALRDRLLAFRLDVAIDLSRAGVSRELLRLSGAPFLYGVGGGDWPFLSADFVFNTHDRWTGHDMTPHSTKVLAMIEALGAILAGPAPVVRRDDLPRVLVERYGLAANDHYVVLHLGARIGFSRWPHHAALVRLLLERTDLKVVAIGDADAGAAFPDDLSNDSRFLLLARRLSFDDLDALLSYAAVVVGNDSGPKHLAALRGTPVVTIFSARINWTEWGQEGNGVVISRKVPCAGCAILHEPENCGKAFACITDIKPNEVFEQVVRLAEPASN
jgi:ADP-heptose:LPS heptosyltransferase/tetratricopeptide (TPR) repeat protein